MADIPLPGGAPGQIPAGSLSSVPGPKALLSAQELGALFAPGAVVSGRVVQPLGSDQYLLAMRGANVVVLSQTALRPDSVVRFQVLATGEQVQLRMLDGSAADQAQTSTSADRLQALGLPPGSASALALSAFEDAGAPLSRAPLLAAAATLAGQAQGTATSANAAALAGALAALARDALPATPATIAMALRALAAALPAAGATLPPVQQAAGVLLTLLAAAAGAAPSPSASAVGAASGQQDPATSAAAQPSPAAAGPPPASPAPASGPAASASPAMPMVPGAAAAATPAGTVPPSATPTSPARATTPAATALPSAAVGALLASAGSSSTAAAARPPPALPASGSAAAGAPPAPVPAAASGSAGTAILAAGVTVAGDPDAVPAASGATLPAALPASHPGPGIGSAQESPIGALRALLSLSVPDATVDGAPAVMQALALSGLRSGAATGPAASLLRHLAAALPPAPSAGVPAAGGGGAAAAAAAQTALTAALVHAVREGSAATLVKPAALADYDQVLGVPLQDQGAAVPTRLAVASRPTAGGTATYLRVDTELSHLGAVSVRLSGIAEGPMVITLLADGGGARALAAALPALAQGLHELGLTAGLRVASLAGEDGHG